MHHTSKKRIVATGMIGNILEWYDFSLYGYFASILSVKFFHSGNELLSLLATFGVFAIGYLMRPLGAMVFGHFGDKLGRKKILSLSILIMATATTTIGLLPTYEQIGVMAGILLTLCRLMQGFAIGGECSGSILYVVEHAEEERRGFFGSIFMASTYLGLLLGALTGSSIGLLMGPEDFESWGWRIPFLLGSLLGVVGYFLRTRMPETPLFTSLEEKKQIVSHPLLTLLKTHPLTLLKGIALDILPATTCYVVFVYFPTYLAKYRDIHIAEGLLSGTLSMGLMVLLIPLIGKLSDKIGRKPIIIASSIALLLSSYPLFVLLGETHSFTTILTIQIILALILACLDALIPATLVELFPTHIRYSATGISFNVANGIFGGMTPLLLSIIVASWGSVGMAGYVMVFSLVTLTAAVALKESYRKKLHMLA